MTFHLRFIPIDTKHPADIAFIQQVFRPDQDGAECLDEHDRQQYYGCEVSQSLFINSQNAVLWSQLQIITEKLTRFSKC